MPRRLSSHDRRHSHAVLRAALCGVALAAGLIGCTHQRHVARPLEPAAAQSAWQAASPDDDASRAALARHGIDTSLWPLPAWDVDALTALALARHPDIALARAEQRQTEAEQAATAARAGRSAELVTERHSDSADGRSPWSLGVVFDGLATGAAQQAARGDAARALATEAGHRAAQTAWQVRQRVRLAHRDVYFARQAADAAAAVVQQRGALTAAAQRRLARGAADGAEALRTQQAEADARQQLGRAQEHVARARLALAAAIDLPLARAAALPLRFDELRADALHVDAAQADALHSGERRVDASRSHARLVDGRSVDQRVDQRVADAADAAAVPPPDLLQSQALLNRLDVRAALARYAAADAALRLELARQWPDLVLRPGFLWDQGDRVWSLGLAIAWPPGGRNQAAIAAAEAQRATEAARFAAVQSTALTALDSATQAAHTARQQRTAALQRLALAQQAAQRAERRLAAGDADRAEVLNAAAAAAEAHAQWVAAEAASWAAHGALEDAVQRPFAAPGSALSGSAAPPADEGARAVPLRAASARP